MGSKLNWIPCVAQEELQGRVPKVTKQPFQEFGQKETSGLQLIKSTSRESSDLRRWNTHWPFGDLEVDEGCAQAGMCVQ